MKKIAEGVYVAEDGTLHLDLPEMCIAAGFEPTQENQETIQRAAMEMLPGATFEDFDDGWGSWQ